MNKNILNKNDFVIIKNCLKEYATSLEMKLCDIAMAQSNCNNIELENKLNKEFNNITVKWESAINTLKKLF